MRTILIPGTDAWDNDDRVEWYTSTSSFASMLLTYGIPVYFGDGRPFVWSTRLGGIWGLDMWNSHERLATWSAAGINLFDYVVPVETRQASEDVTKSDVNLIVHSHALQVALFALAAGLRVRTMISVGSPIRKDVAAATLGARANVDYWLHIHSDHSDSMQWLGEIGDGWFGIIRKAPLADRNDSVKGVGHSLLLRDPANTHYWIERGWIDTLHPNFIFSGHRQSPQIL